MIAALIRPAMGTVTNHAMKMFLNRRQSTAFFERSHPTATTDPTWKQSRSLLVYHQMYSYFKRSIKPEGCVDFSPHLLLQLQLQNG